MGCTCKCAQCSGGYHIFCNKYPHGEMSEAVQWFREHPEAMYSVTAIGEEGKAALEEAKRLGPIPRRSE